MSPSIVRERNKIQSILIIGAGLAGLTAAIALQQAKFDVTVLEKATALYESGAGIQIPPNCSRVLGALGVLDRIRSAATTPHNLVIWSHEGDQLHRQAINSSDDEKYNSPHLVIHRADFTRILYEEALRQGVRIEFDARVININFESGSVILHTGRIMQADLTIGADGEHSLCRELFQGPCESFRSVCASMVYRLMIPSSVLAVDPMLGFLVEPVSIQAWYGPGSHAITYHMERDQTLNVVLTLPASTETYTIGPHFADLQLLRQKFRNWDPRFQKLISLADQVQCWSLFEYAILSKWEHLGGKFILLGDAAHPVLPYIAQGAAIAIESAFILSDLLSRCPDAKALPGLLRAFAASRKSRTLSIRDWSKKMEDAFRQPEHPTCQAPACIPVKSHLKASTGFPYPLADPAIQDLIWNFNVHEETESLWERYAIAQ